MIKHHCDWCGARVEKHVETEVEFEGMCYDLCKNCYHKYHKIISPIRNQFKSNPDPVL